MKLFIHANSTFHVGIAWMIKPQKKYVVCSGKDRFLLGDDIIAISLVELMRETAKMK